MDDLMAKYTIAAEKRYRGHPTVCFEEEQWRAECYTCWRYASDLARTPEDEDEGGVERPCVQCGVVAEPLGPDPCFGLLPGVVAACCGHGVQAPSILLQNRTLLKGKRATRYVRHWGGSRTWTGHRRLVAVVRLCVIRLWRSTNYVAVVARLGILSRESLAE